MSFQNCQIVKDNQPAVIANTQIIMDVRSQKFQTYGAKITVQYRRPSCFSQDCRGNGNLKKFHCNVVDTQMFELLISAGVIDNLPGGRDLTPNDCMVMGYKRTLWTGKQESWAIAQSVKSLFGWSPIQGTFCVSWRLSTGIVPRLRLCCGSETFKINLRTFLYYDSKNWTHFKI